MVSSFNLGEYFEGENMCARQTWLVIGWGLGPELRRDLWLAVVCISCMIDKLEVA